MSTETQPVIRVRDLKKSFQGKPVLKGIDLDLMLNENLVLIGKSGAGKSVLIKCIIRLLEADDGEVRVFDTDIQKVSERGELNSLRRKIGFLFQGGALYDSMTVEENLHFPMDRLPHPPDKQKIDQKIQEVLENVGLADARPKYPSELSGGMKKRIALARTLILEPEILLYDEPTAGLDPVTKRDISELIVSMQEKYGISSIVITHDMLCAEITANRMAAIRDGEIIESGTFEEMKKSDDQWINAFFN